MNDRSDTMPDTPRCFHVACDCEATHHLGIHFWPTGTAHLPALAQVGEIMLLLCREHALTAQVVDVLGPTGMKIIDDICRRLRIARPTLDDIELFPIDGLKPTIVGAGPRVGGSLSLH